MCERLLAVADPRLYGDDGDDGDDGDYGGGRDEVTFAGPTEAFH